VGINVGRTKKELPEEWKDIIKQGYEKDRLNLAYLEKTIYDRYKIRVPYNVIMAFCLNWGTQSMRKASRNVERHE